MIKVLKSFQSRPSRNVMKAGNCWNLATGGKYFEGNNVDGGKIFKYTVHILYIQSHYFIVRQDRTNFKPIWRKIILKGISYLQVQNQLTIEIIFWGKKNKKKTVNLLPFILLHLRTFLFKLKSSTTNLKKYTFAFYYYNNQVCI